MFGNTLASLVVKILVDYKRYNQDMKGAQNKLVNFTAGFYLLSTAIRYGTQGLLSYIDKLKTVEEGYTRIERLSSEFRGEAGEGFRMEIMEIAMALHGINLKTLQQLMEQAGQLGLRGRDELESFAASVAKLALLTHKDPGDLVLDLGRIMEGFGVDPANIDRTINTILQLADSTVATEQDIISMVERLAGLAEASRMTFEQVAALSASMRDLGQTAEIGRTTLVRLITNVSTRQLELADVMGLSSAAADDWFDTMARDPYQGILYYLEHLNNQPLTKQVELLNAAGLGTSRYQGAALVLAANLDNLAESYENSTKGANENVRLMEQFEARADTLTDKLDTLDDAWTRFITNVGNSAAFKGFIDDIADMLDQAAKGMENSDLYNSPPTTDYTQQEAESDEDYYNRLKGTFTEQMAEQAKLKQEAIENIDAIAGKGGNEFVARLFTDLHTLLGVFYGPNQTAGEYQAQLDKATARMAEIHTQMIKLEENRLENKEELTELEEEQKRLAEEQAELNKKARRQRDIDKVFQSDANKGLAGYSSSPSRLKQLGLTNEQARALAQLEEMGFPLTREPFDYKAQTVIVNPFEGISRQISMWSKEAQTKEFEFNQVPERRDIGFSTLDQAWQKAIIDAQDVQKKQLEALEVANEINTDNNAVLVKIKDEVSKTKPAIAG